MGLPALRVWERRCRWVSREMMRGMITHSLSMLMSGNLVPVGDMPFECRRTESGGEGSKDRDSLMGSRKPGLRLEIASGICTQEDGRYPKRRRTAVTAGVWIGTCYHCRRTAVGVMKVPCCLCSQRNLNHWSHAFSSRWLHRTSRGTIPTPA